MTRALRLAPKSPAEILPLSLSPSRCILEGPKEVYIEILHRPERRLVTVLELLSPANKELPGRTEYLTKTPARVLPPGFSEGYSLVSKTRPTPATPPKIHPLRLCRPTIIFTSSQRAHGA